MNKYDLFSAESKKGRTFFFIWNEQERFIECKGTDLSSALNILFFKLRSFYENVSPLISALNSGELEYAKKEYGEIIDSQIQSNYNNLFQDDFYTERESQIKIAEILNKDSEKKVLDYIAKFKTDPELYNKIRTESSMVPHFIKIANRESIVKNTTNRFQKLLLNPENQGKKNTLLFNRNEIESLVYGPNGDLWVEVVLNEFQLTQEELIRVFQLQGLTILKFPDYLNSVDLILSAIDGTKTNKKDLIQLHNSLPDSIKSNTRVKNYFNWQLNLGSFF